MNCILYARVSTDKQAAKDLSIPAQLTLMREHAQRQGWTVVDEFIEPGESATTAANRPVLQGILSRIQSGGLKIDTVVSHKLNRMARNLDDYVPLRALLNKYGVRLTYVVEKIDDTPSGRLLENIMASIAQFESANLSEETKKGMRQKVLTGGWPHQAPKGYMTTKGTSRSKVDIHPRLGPLMRMAFELYATGLYSIEGVARKVASAGLVTSSGRPLAKSNLHRLLTNVFYTGRLRWKDLEVDGSHAPLISRELFDKVQATIHDRFREFSRKPRTAGLPLRGLAICASCRGNISGEWHRKWAYYRCSRQSYRRELCNAKLCSAKRAHADLERICQQTQISRAAAKKIQVAAVRLIGERTSRDRVSGSEGDRSDIVEREMTLTAAFAAGDVPPEEYQRQAEVLRSKRLQLETVLAAAGVAPTALMAKVTEKLQIATTLWDLYQQFDDERRIQLLRTIFRTVILSSDGIIGYALNSPFNEMSSIRSQAEAEGRHSADHAALTILDAE